MRKRPFIILCIITLAVLAAGWFGRDSEPKYKGVRLGALLDNTAPNVGRGLPDRRPFSELMKAVQELGPRAVPYLTKVLEREPTKLQQWYGRNWQRLPASMQRFAPRPQSFTQRRSMAAAALSRAGTNAVTSIPMLLNVATNDSFFGSRHNAVGTLANIAPGTEFEAAAATAIISRTTDENEGLREHAYNSLGAFTNQMDKVVPILLHGLRSAEAPAVRESAIKSLRRFGTNAMPVVRSIVQNGGNLPWSFEALEREFAGGVENAE